ncbi:MAG: citrate/2-methylcitrate synthase, partial [Gemmatimonadota bacterium]|nr:citrate/2-methylcitrate synthase [Gemmatimonadota bacterium]
MPDDTITIIDNRTGKQYELPIIYGTYPDYGAAINTGELRQIKESDDDFGLMGFDPGFTNTASCRSSVTFIDGDKGILKYRGYTIEELAEKSSFLEVAYLLLYGDLPTQSQMDDWTYEITHHSFVHENIKKFMDGFRYDAHPMGILISTVAALSAFYPES